MGGIENNNEVSVAVATVVGGGLGAMFKSFTGNRRVDKVDAVKAVSDAYQGVIKRLETQLDAVQGEVAELRSQNFKLWERLVDKAEGATRSAP